MEERVINGVLCRRLDPSGEWSPVSRPELTKMLVDLRKAYELLAASTSLIVAKDIYDIKGTY